MNEPPVSPVAPPPWFDDAWQRLQSARRAGRLPHALLLSSPQGTGLDLFARAMAAVLLCGQPHDGEPCGQCHACRLYAAGTHPDYRELIPEKRGAQLRIAQVRELIDFAHVTAQQGGYRVVFLYPAEALNLSAANALLKTLEEPGEQTLLLLGSHTLATLPATIRSRCQLIELPMPAPEQALTWLRAGGADESAATRALDAAFGAPLLAQAYLRGHDDDLQLFETLGEALAGGLSPLAAAESCRGREPLIVVDGLYRLLARRCRELPPGDARLRRCFALVDELIGVRAGLLRGTNPNAQLLVESLLIRGRGVFGR